MFVAGLTLASWTPCVTAAAVGAADPPPVVLDALDTSNLGFTVAAARLARALEGLDASGAGRARDGHICRPQVPRRVEAGPAARRAVGPPREPAEPPLACCL